METQPLLVGRRFPTYTEVKTISEDSLGYIRMKHFSLSAGSQVREDLGIPSEEGFKIGPVNSNGAVRHDVDRVKRENVERLTKENQEVRL